MLFRVKVPAFNGLNVCCAANIAIEHCPQCGGNLKIIAVIGRGACDDFHITNAPGLACARAAALTGSAAASLPRGLILKARVVLTGRCARAALRMRVVVKVGRNQPPRVDAETDKPAQEEDFHQTSRDSPLLGPAIQSCMEK